MLRRPASPCPPPLFARWRASPWWRCRSPPAPPGPTTRLVEHRLRPRGAGGGQPVRWRNAPPAATWPAAPRWTPATCAARRQDFEAALAAAPDNLELRQQVFALLLVQRPVRPRAARPHVTCPNATPRPTKPSCCWRLDATRRGSRRRGFAAAGGAGSRQHCRPRPTDPGRMGALRQWTQGPGDRRSGHRRPQFRPRPAARLSPRRHARPGRPAARGPRCCCTRRFPI